MGGGGGGTIQDFGASTQAMGTAFDQWTDYRQRFVPYQHKLANTVATGDMWDQDIGFAKNAMTTAFDNARGAQTRDLGRLGAVQTPEQQQAADAKLGLDQAAQTGAAINAARMHTLDSNLAVMSGGMGTMRERVTKGAGAY